MLTQSTTSPTHRALVAIDLGAESCRVSLLRWHNDTPYIELLHRIPNGPIQSGGNSNWPLDQILIGIEEGLQKAAAQAPEGIQSIAVDGWAVDYVRLEKDGQPLHAPYCYRDERTIAAKAQADTLISPEDFFKQTGAQPLRINTAYQLVADNQTAPNSTPWINLPEYILHWLGGRRVAEYTNATHTGLVDIQTRNWSPEIFHRLGLDITAAPPIVSTGTNLGKLTHNRAQHRAFKNTQLIAPACHDTASAIAAITEDMAHTAYIVSGTWSLIGTIIDDPITTPDAQHAGFTNQGAAGGGYLFHTNINGMWLIKQCLDHWKTQRRNIDLPSLIAQAANVPKPPGILHVDAPELMLAGDMPARINSELEKSNLESIPDNPGNEPVFARLIFESLSARYATVLRDLEALTSRHFTRIVILGGGSRNTLLTHLTRQTTGLTVQTGEVEGSTIGNFAVQLAAHDRLDANTPLSTKAIRDWAAQLLSHQKETS